MTQENVHTILPEKKQNMRFKNREASNVHVMSHSNLVQHYEKEKNTNSSKRKASPTVSTNLSSPRSQSQYDQLTALTLTDT